MPMESQVSSNSITTFTPAPANPAHVKTLSCRTGPLRVGRAFERLFRLSRRITSFGPPVGREMMTPTNGRAKENHLCKTGIHAMKWPLEPGSPSTGLRLRGGRAQWAVRQDINLYLIYFAAA